MKKEATKPAAQNLLPQQARFDDFLDCDNCERPHQALDMKCPAELYRPSPRPYRGLRELTYPFHDRTITVTHCGRICMAPHKITLSTVFAGQNVGVKQVGDKIWLVSFMDYDLGFFDEETTRLEPIANPFEAKVLPMCPERTSRHCPSALATRSAITIRSGVFPCPIPLPTIEAKLHWHVRYQDTGINWLRAVLTQLIKGRSAASHSPRQRVATIN